jgi:hypothetical protein
VVLRAFFVVVLEASIISISLKDIRFHLLLNLELGCSAESIKIFSLKVSKERKIKMKININ